MYNNIHFIKNYYKQTKCATIVAHEISSNWREVTPLYCYCCPMILVFTG